MRTRIRGGKLILSARKLAAKHRFSRLLFVNELGCFIIELRGKEKEKERGREGEREREREREREIDKNNSILTTLRPPYRRAFVGFVFALLSRTGK